MENYIRLCYVVRWVYWLLVKLNYFLNVFYFIPNKIPAQESLHRYRFQIYIVLNEDET